MRTLLFQVTGMHCQSCADNLSKALQATDGVSAVQVDFAARTARVEADEAAVKPSDLMNVVRRAGYQVDSFRAVTA